MAKETLRWRSLFAGREIAVIGRISADGAPVVGGAGGNNAATKKIGDNQGKGFVFRQTPLGGEVPVSGFGLFILFGTDNSFDVRADQGENRVGGDEPGESCYE